MIPEIDFIIVRHHTLYDFVPFKVLWPGYDQVNVPGATETNTYSAVFRCMTVTFQLVDNQFYIFAIFLSTSIYYRGRSAEFQLQLCTFAVDLPIPELERFSWSSLYASCHLLLVSDSLASILRDTEVEMRNLPSAWWCFKFCLFKFIFYLGFVWFFSWLDLYYVFLARLLLLVLLCIFN